MSKKYKVSRDVINIVNQAIGKSRHKIINREFLNNLLQCDDPDKKACKYFFEKKLGDLETNNRLIALARYMNGEDVFDFIEPMYYWKTNSGYWLGLIDKYDRNKIPTIVSTKMFAGKFTVQEIKNSDFEFSRVTSHTKLRD